MKDFGSIGSGDTLFALGLQQDDALIRPGDLVVLASSGIGFTWGAQVIGTDDIRSYGIISHPLNLV